MKPHRIALSVALCTASILATVTARANNETDYLTPEISSWGRVLGHVPALNGRDLNGRGLNGDSLEGRLVTGVSAHGTLPSGVSLQDVWLDESRLRGTDARGRKVAPDGFVGAVFQGALDDGNSLTLHVQAITRHPDKANKDVYGYEVWYENQSSLLPLCGVDDSGIPLLAIPLAGRWSYEEGTADGGSWIDDPAAFTFACDGYVLAKCVVAGYKPWKEAKICSASGKKAHCEKTTLAASHQACTRALRADYFGDGTSHTVNGTVVNMYDGFGVRVDSADWPVEAEWNADGAVCVGHTRIAAEQASAAPLFAEDCGDVAFFQQETLIITEAVAY